MCLVLKSADTEWTMPIFLPYKTGHLYVDSFMETVIGKQVFSKQ